MADDADRAEEYQEIALEAAISAARGVRPDPRTYCRECDELLQEHRRPYGLCLPCATRIEAISSRYRR